LQRQQARDQLQAVEKTVLEFLRQHGLPLRELVFLPQQYLFAREDAVQFIAQSCNLGLLVIVFHARARGTIRHAPSSRIGDAHKAPLG
jgi:hypothetical protein